MSSEFAEDIAPWILEVAEKRAADYARRKASKAAFRAERKAAREHGLIARHDRKLARNRRPEMLF